MDRNGASCGFILGGRLLYYGMCCAHIAMHLISSCIVKVLQVIMTQGMMYGLSSGLLFAPCISFVDEWFLKRRGLANGIL